MAASAIVIVGRDGDGLALVDRDALPEAALDMGKAHGAAHESHVEAVVALSCSTVAARVAWLARVDGDPHAGLHPGHLAADLVDRAGDLVPKRHRLPQADGPEAAVVVIVQVGAANPSGLDPDTDITRPERRRLDLLDPKILRSMDDDAAHGLSFRRDRELGCATAWLACSSASCLQSTASMPPST